MKLVFVHNVGIDAEWHRAEWREGQPAPLRKALCSALATTLSADDSYDSWAYVWNRAIDPPGRFCARCDQLAVTLAPGRAQQVADRLIESVFGPDGAPL